MDSTTITKTHAKKVSDGLFPGFNYLFRLRERMQATGFPHDDPLFAKVEAAYDAYHRLMVEVRGLAASGAGRPSNSDAE
jgi:hypothetical protein